jgi:uncharacterized membrane protein YesL
VLLGLRVVGSAFRQVLTHVTASVFSNLFAAVLSLPIVLIAGVGAYASRSFSLIPLGVAMLAGVLPNPFAAGLHTVAQELATAGYATFGEHWTGLRQHFLPALKTWLVSLAITVLILANIVFYLRELGSGAGVVGSVAPGLVLVWGIVFLLWIAIHLYVFPLLLLQEVKSVRLVYRNAFMMALARPAVTACVAAIWVILLLLFSTTGLITFIGFAICCAIQHTVASRLLPTFRLQAAS